MKGEEEVRDKVQELEEKIKEAKKKNEEWLNPKRKKWRDALKWVLEEEEIDSW